MSTRYAIVQVDPQAHGREALDLLVRNFPLPAEVMQARYPKYYERNPAGPPLVFFAQEEESQRTVGMTALFPTTLRVDGEPVPGGIDGDFVVDRGHRGFGPAVALQRALLAALPGNGLRYAYGCPNPNSDPVTNRVGFAEVGALTRFVKILKAKVVIDAYVRPPAVARVAAALAPYTVDPVLSVLSRERIHRRTRALVVERPERFDDRFLPVFEAGRRQHRVILERTPALLNWKFDLDGAPASAGKYAVLALTAKDETVAAYAVLRTADGVRHVEDIGYLPSRLVLDTLLAALVRDARADGVEAVGLLYLGPGNLLTARLRAFGFLARSERAKLRVFVPEGAAPPADLLDRQNWFFVAGDTDI